MRGWRIFWSSEVPSGVMPLKRICETRPSASPSLRRPLPSTRELRKRTWMPSSSKAEAAARDKGQLETWGGRNS